MGILDIITRVERLGDGIKEIQIEDSDDPCGITVDSELSTTSENPVQNKVITGAILEQQTQINDLQENKQDYSPYIRKIYIGSDATPSNTLGEDGDLYIYLPN